MKILITGANGSIGSDLVSSFSEKHKVYAIYRSSNKVVKKLKNKNITWIKQDIKSKIKLKSKIDVLIHCAFIHEFSKKKTYKDYVSSNIIGLKNIIEFANKKKIKSFIYLSSVTIYGEIKEDSLTDNNKFINPSILGASKILSEKMIEKQKFNYLNLRLPGVISYLNNDYRRPWLNNIIYNLKIGKKITVFNSNLYFNNIID
ncbi:SDR family oxidoreductase, partial [Candidatus Pelagibacter sp.]|nr:SDR family oxidoreductase [Candidatus Pelagibacter sp.]